MTEFSNLEGQIIEQIDGLHNGSDNTTFHTMAGYQYRMYHSTN